MFCELRASLRILIPLCFLKYSIVIARIRFHTSNLKQVSTRLCLYFLCNTSGIASS